jgi:hypothetical protein
MLDGISHIQFNVNSTSAIMASTKYTEGCLRTKCHREYSELRGSTVEKIA